MSEMTSHAPPTTVCRIRGAPAAECHGASAGAGFAPRPLKFLAAAVFMPETRVWKSENPVQAPGGPESGFVRS